MTRENAVDYNPYAADFYTSDPVSVYRWMRDEAPVYHSEQWGWYALTRFEDVRAAITDPDTFRSFEGMDIDDTGKEQKAPGSLPDMDNPRHDEIRRIVQPFFLPRRIATLREGIRSVVRGLIEPWRDRGEVDLAQELAWPMPFDVFFQLVGLPGKRDESPEQVARRELVLFLGGVDSTVGLTTSLFTLLAENPDQRALLQRDPSLIPAAIEETLRCSPPLQLTARTTAREVTLHGVTIPAGGRVVLVLGAANRDERQFPDPDTFDVTRGRFRHMGFGEGVHGCLGAPPTRLEATTAAEEALPLLGDYELSSPPVFCPSSPNMYVWNNVPITFPTPARP